MLDAQAIEVIEEILKAEGTAEVKLESGKITVVELGKRKIKYKSQQVK